MFILILTLLGLPALVVLFSFMSLPLVVLVGLGLVLLIFSLHRSCQDNGDILRLRVDLKRHWLLLVIVSTLVSLVHVNPFASVDWDKHYAILKLLIDNNWPPVFNIAGEERLLRYGLGWYIIPALLAKLAGVEILNLILCFWTSLCIFSILLLACGDQRKTWQLFVVALVFFLFSGLDIIGAWVKNYPFDPNPDWLQWWAGWGQISPNMFGITWVPQHALAGWAGAVLFLQERYHALRYGVPIFAFVAMWSPLAAVGIVLPALWAIVQEGIKPCLTACNLLSMVFLAAPALIYLTLGTSHNVFGFHFIGADRLDFLFFWLIEFLLIGVLILFAKPTNVGLICAITIFLCCATLFKIDHPNNWLMRVSMPSVFILSLLAARTLLQGWHWRKIPLMVYLIVAAIPVIVSYSTSIDYSSPRALYGVRFANTVDSRKEQIGLYSVPLEDTHIIVKSLLR